MPRDPFGNLSALAGPTAASSGAPGHGGVRRLLAGAASRGRVPQALLLSGPRDIGKSGLARWFAEMLLCERGGDAPCGACRACRLAHAGSHPDLLLAAPGLKVDTVRELQRQLVLSPTESAHRIAVLPDIDTATSGAANALLKTLEEPPSYVILILTSSVQAEVLPTIRSRCQVVPMHLLLRAEVEAELERVGVPDDERAFLARLAGGRLNWALEAARDPSVLERRGKWLDGLAEAASGPVHRKLEIAEGLAGDRDDVLEGLAFWRTYLRDVLLVSLGSPEGIVNVDRQDLIATWARDLGPAPAAAALEAVEQALDRVVANVNRQLALEALVMELPA